MLAVVFIGSSMFLRPHLNGEVTIPERALTERIESYCRDWIKRRGTDWDDLGVAGNGRAVAHIRLPVGARPRVQMTGWFCDSGVVKEIGHAHG